MSRKAVRGGAVVVVLSCLMGSTSCGGLSPSAPTVPSCKLPEPQTVHAGDYIGQLLADDACRDYRLHVPPGYDPARPSPLVIVLHGYTGTSANMESGSGLSRTADGAGFLAVYPQGLGNAWDLSMNGRDSRFLRGLIAHIQASATIDRRRIFVTGFSMGGGMANRAACDLSDVLAASAPVSGSYQGHALCNPVRPVPILGIHGTDDTTVPPAGRPDVGWPPLGDWIAGWANRDGCAPAPVTLDDAGLTETAWRACGGGAEVRLLLVTGLGHTWWPPANDRIWDFFEAHPLPG